MTTSRLQVLLIADHWTPMPEVELELGWLDLPAEVPAWEVRDIWNGRAMGSVQSTGAIPSGSLDVHDSRFYVLSPSA